MTSNQAVREQIREHVSNVCGDEFLENCIDKVMDIFSQSQQQLLERLLKNGHGGGNFRRLIEAERSKLSRLQEEQGK